jgi:hypothetical protein
MYVKWTLRGSGTQPQSSAAHLFQGHHLRRDDVRRLLRRRQGLVPGTDLTNPRFGRKYFTYRTSFCPQIVDKLLSKYNRYKFIQ